MRFAIDPNLVKIDAGVIALALFIILVDEIIAMKAKAVIPPLRHRKVCRDYDRSLYKERNMIERMFGKMKHFRAIATRYNKLAISFLAFLQLAAILLWLK